MGTVISFSNHKGGVGKSCSVCNLGAGISNFGKQGKQVLLIDLDPQANLSLHLGITEPVKSIYNALKGECKLKDTIVKVTDKLHVVPATLDLSGAELELASEAGRELILKELVDDVKGKYDYILIDCPPRS